MSSYQPVALVLVLVHHSLRFPTASWKQVRSRLDAGMPQKTATPDQDFPDEAAIDHQRRHYRSYRDHLAFDIAAHTLFVVGSPTAFREYGTALRGLVDQAPSFPYRYPHAGHFGVELGPGPGCGTGGAYPPHCTSSTPPTGGCEGEGEAGSGCEARPGARAGARASAGGTAEGPAGVAAGPSTVRRGRSQRSERQYASTPERQTLTPKSWAMPTRPEA
ncbi:hypothetical protein OG250_23360 [Streptomyces sp. NBC_00487]|uniref:hypothetical protein n=1 Tax=unclassified Streptomyces TaxID=2593676 RepID=UPI002E18CDA8|nr:MULTISPECIES: hypothetical protein [unclassified Streptomyces]